ncbi:MAG TPA: ATP-dependent zinc metalloprotease FtsH [Chitinophagales bacterium]|nr:ATP-dependent zinc metalloprotease FtsH [Chitinophagales bacterium]HRK28895.1 ATP-dependent zinc metalloprotease FtsH [Chitinophagales bacterium]
MSNNNIQKPDSDNKPGKFNHYWIYGLILLGIIALNLIPFQSHIKETSEQNFFREMLPSGDVEKLNVVNKEIVEVFIKQDRLSLPKYNDIRSNKFGAPIKGPHYIFTIGSNDNFIKTIQDAQKDVTPDNVVTIKYESRTDWRAGFLSYLLPFIIIIVIWIIIMRRVSGGVGGPGGQIFNIGKSKATLLEGDSKVDLTFDDVAGLDEAKEEVREIVDFLKNPQKYTALGGKIPKGVLLIGPPGTGKTLLAKAVAGEAQVPFFTISGSDFVELFVGVGASRVRDLFKQAREKAPCIIFIDEIDAVGRARGRNMIQGNDERENTLNALLVEMDGFAGDKGVIIMAATNRPDVLDSALMRPGRFDRQISIDRPDLKGREQIFKVHLRPLKTANDIDAKKLAAQTPGFAGADIANVCNEAALIAARYNKKSIDMQDFQSAIDRVIGGLEKKNKIISPEEKEIIAYHEAGHAIAGWFLKHAHPLLKVTIIPRGVAALGYAQYVPKEQYLYTTEQLMDEMCMTLGGRAAEDIIFGRISTGAQNDLERITKMAYAMVSIYGMNTKVGNVSFYDAQGEYSFQKPYSDATALMIDEEVRALINQAYQRTKELLTEKRVQLEQLAKELLKKEILHKDDLERLIGSRPFEEHAEPEDALAPASVKINNSTHLNGEHI